MRITDLSKPVELTKIGAVEGTKGVQAPKTVARAEASEVLNVNVSGKAQELSARAGRLEELKASIRDGSFKADANKIATKLLGEDE